MSDACIIYPYFGFSGILKDVIVQNYSSHVRNNPREMIIPVSIYGSDWIPGTVLVDPWMDKDIYRFCRNHNAFFYYDYLFWAYLKSSFRVDADRYILLDWDTYSHNISVQDFLHSVWNVDVGSDSLTMCCDTHSFWCGDWCTCHPVVYNFQSGAVLLLSRNAANQLVNVPADSFCNNFHRAPVHIRIPTLAAYYNLQVIGNAQLGQTLNRHFTQKEIKTPAIYHSVRNLLSEEIACPLMSSKDIISGVYVTN